MNYTPATFEVTEITRPQLSRRVFVPHLQSTATWLEACPWRVEQQSQINPVSAPHVNHPAMNVIWSQEELLLESS